MILWSLLRNLPYTFMVHSMFRFLLLSTESYALKWKESNMVSFYVLIVAYQIKPWIPNWKQQHSCKRLMLNEAWVEFRLWSSCIHAFWYFLKKIRYVCTCDFDHNFLYRNSEDVIASGNAEKYKRRITGSAK